MKRNKATSSTRHRISEEWQQQASVALKYATGCTVLALVAED
jgi:hypothetical protein